MNRRSFFGALVALPLLVRTPARIIQTGWIRPPLLNPKIARVGVGEYVVGMNPASAKHFSSFRLVFTSVQRAAGIVTMGVSRDGETWECA